jgi:P27 family predicted phage terminase small subunit
MRGRKPQPKSGGVTAVDFGFPPPPAGMTPAARVEWLRIGAQMGDQLINRLDEAVLEAYCETRVRVRKLNRAIGRMKTIVSTNKKTGNKMASLLVSQVAKQEAHLSKLASELGLTPISRTRVAATAAGESKEVTLADMIKNRPQPMRIAK